MSFAHPRGQAGRAEGEPPLYASTQPRTTELAIGQIARVDLPWLCVLARELLVRSGADVLVCDVACASLDLVLVEAVARLTLTARRLERGLRVEGASAELRDLLALCGLDHLVAVDGWWPDKVPAQPSGTSCRSSWR